ncbi:MAG: ABC transporter permease subunit [Bacteriovoracia bacterium]
MITHVFERLWILFVGLFLVVWSASAADGDELPVLKWGADSEGGAPYIMQDPADPARVIGYEVDLMEAVAAQMGRRSEFVQNQWDGLIPGLNRGNYDLVVNGLEITEDRKAEVLFSDPYYVTYEQLTVRKETSHIQSLRDLPGRKVGTLKATLAERILQGFGQGETTGAGQKIEVVSYDGQINAYEDLALGRVEAVLMDWPIALYYGHPNPKLKPVGLEISDLAYGMGIRKRDTALQREVNAAIATLKANGKLREIYERWGMWNPRVASFLRDMGPPQHQPDKYMAYLKAVGMERDWRVRLQQYAGYLPLLIDGAWMTLKISFLAMALAVSFGLLLTLVRLYAPAPLSTLSVAYIELVRGTPLLIQLFFIFYGLPNLGISLSPIVAAVLGLGLNYAAYESENYRAGICSMPKSQFEAAKALGFSERQSLFHIILPQAIRVVIPPVTNDFISLLKDSSLVSVITMVELTKVYGQLASTYYDYFGIGVMTAILYLVMGLPFVLLSRMAEKKFAVAGTSGATLVSSRGTGGIAGGLRRVLSGASDRLRGRQVST